MLKELVEKYQPNTLFTDGEWEHESSVWHSTEFLQWLYNESSVKDFIVPNDRWGKETRGRKGGNFTTEYGIIDVYLGTERRIEDVELDRPFEECRGIGGSFGINKEEGCENYLSVKELLKTLCSLVSKGGNFLLNIGPDADGTIPPLMEERLLGMGKWLEVNGEAIYDSEVYVKTKEEGLYYTKNGNNIYAITEIFPSKKQTFAEIPFSNNLKVSLLGSDAKVEIFNDDGKLSLKADIDSPVDIDSQYLYTYKISK
jgi:alpha-L-fucosidase